MHLPCPAPNDSRTGGGGTTAFVPPRANKAKRLGMLAQGRARVACQPGQPARHLPTAPSTQGGASSECSAGVLDLSTCRSSTRAAVSQAYQIGAEPRGGEALGNRLKLSGLVHPSAWPMVRTWGAVNIASPPVGNVSCPARCHHINRQHLSALHPGRPGPRRAPRRQATEALTIHVSDRSAAPPQMPPPICLAARLETRLGCVFFSFFASARHFTPDYVHAPLGYTATLMRV